MTKVVYDKVAVILKDNEGKHGPVTAEDAKEYLGWEVEEGDKNFGDNFMLRDMQGRKVRCNNVPTNRPFRPALADKYTNEMIRKKWRLNGETIIIDRHGCVQSGQHRLIGLVLAEEMRQKEAAHYREHFGWRTAVTAEMLIVTGISEKAEVVDSIDLGQKRNLADVFYRRREFKKAGKKDQERLSRILAGAARLAWLRSGGKTVSDAPGFPHSEAIDFLESHPKLNDAAEFVFNEDGGGEKRISSMISLSYAAGLLYLMGAALTDPIKWLEKGPEALNFKNWGKAEEFWALMASGEDLPKGNAVLLCRNAITRMEASSSQGRDELVGVVVKAFGLWVEGNWFSGVFLF